MGEVDPKDLAQLACAMFNRLSAAHNEQVEAFTKAKTGRGPALLASYVALRVMIQEFAPKVVGLVQSDSWEGVEAVIQVLSSHVSQPEPTPAAQA